MPGVTKPWDRPALNHGKLTHDFEVIAADVQSRGLPKPGSGANRRLTIQNTFKPDIPWSVRVGRHLNRGNHPMGEPWYIEWVTPGSAPVNERTTRYTFSTRDDVIDWLKTNGF